MRGGALREGRGPECWKERSWGPLWIMDPRAALRRMSTSGDEMESL